MFPYRNVPMAQANVWLEVDVTALSRESYIIFVVYLYVPAF